MNEKATELTFRHYHNPDIKECILGVSKYGQFHRWGNGDSNAWYRVVDGIKKPLDLPLEYDYIVGRHRTLYWTLNYFDPLIYQIDYSSISSEESRQNSLLYTYGYTFGVDIDTVPTGKEEHGLNIQDPEIKQAVEDMGQYYTDRLREYVPNSVYVLFSGGGIYVMIHHMAFNPYFSKFYNDPEWPKYCSIMIYAVNSMLDTIRQDFFKEYPQHEGKVKADIINNAKRVYKCIFSIHKHHDFAVIPLNPDNVIIDFEDAKLPLKQEVIDRGKTWYLDYDDDGKLLDFLAPNLYKAKEEYDHKPGHIQAIDIDIPDTPIPYSQWPPCIKNILVLEYVGEGRTRALAFLAAFFGEVGLPANQARQMFNGIADRWGAPTANIFESYYGKMHVPTCKHLQADINEGFPKGVSIKCLGVCRPNPRCFNIPSPRYYADINANLERLRRMIFEESISQKDV